MNTSCAACAFNASLQIRRSSHGDHRVASITFSGDIKFRSGSTVKVFGKYALSLTSQNGNILIETDINMTCGEEVLNTTCLGGFTQSSSPQPVGPDGKKKSLFKGEKVFSFMMISLVFIPLTRQRRIVLDKIDNCSFCFFLLLQVIMPKCSN